MSEPRRFIYPSHTHNHHHTPKTNATVDTIKENVHCKRHAMVTARKRKRRERERNVPRTLFIDFLGF